MNVLLVSQCDKRALTETRRILDQFAERRGDCTWQTAITQDGLDTLRKLLRKTARKNTAVACHWIRGRDHSELLWIVGDRRRFNSEGAVPTNTTVRNVLRRSDENDWHFIEDIRLLAQLAALLHDIGKASIAFQERLKGKRTERNLIRHEWVSLRLFLAFVGTDDDAGWLARLANETACNSLWTAAGRLLREGLDHDIDERPFAGLVDHAPIAAAIGWLVVSHHRLPVAPSVKDGVQRRIGARASGFDTRWLHQPLQHVTHAWNEVRTAQTPQSIEPYWQMAAELPVEDPAWRKQAARIARQLLQLRQHRDDWLGNGYVLHLARLSLMLADHHYSSLGLDANGHPVAARKPFVQSSQTLFANTIRHRHGHPQFNQSLLEHLLGVTGDTGMIAHALPGFERYLPRLAQHRGLRKRSADPAFAWQDKAFDAATAMREAAREHGAFVVNMASTGCGKTLANARVLYAFADPQQGLRATFALGLRTLTLQTGRSYRQDLQLGDDELAVLVGGAANRALFAFNEKQAEASGSASTLPLLEEDAHVLYEGVMAEHPLLSRALADPDIRKLLSAPMLVCTTDHIAPATESLRAGRQIAPMLRLMSADLVLDEIDDYDLHDLPAIARLLHWAGMLGTRVVLSSATLPPALAQGLFTAYQAGRRLYHRNRGTDGGRAQTDIDIPCLWIDEFGVLQQSCGEPGTFAQAHGDFVARRVKRLVEQPALRTVRLWELPFNNVQQERLRTSFAAQVHAACLQLHDSHANTDPVTGQKVSFGIVRMANIDPIIDVACALHRMNAPESPRMHLCVYHARFPLAQRSAIEQLLDKVLDRRKAGAAWQHPDVRSAIDAAPDGQHVFVVLASPVCEVGRDWDADWAVCEPSSMRALIQLAGRVQRHRRRPPASPNIIVFDTNLKALDRPGASAPAFHRPGFEDSERFRLNAHRLRTLWPNAEGARVDAVPRILPRPASERRPLDNWIDLEHARIEVAMHAVPNSPPEPRSSTVRARPGAGAASWQWQRDLAAPGWQFPQVALVGVLPQQQPFREDTQPDVTLVFLPDDDEETLIAHRVEDDLQRAGQNPHVQATIRTLDLTQGQGVIPWGAMDVPQLLERVRELAEAEDLTLHEAARRFTAMQVPKNKDLLAWDWHPWLGLRPQH